MTARDLVLRYALFALLATGVNVAAQHLSLGAYAGPYGLGLAIGAGTGAGLVTKYILDRRWIFHAPAAAPKSQGRDFSLYTLTGLFTTSIFWGMELAFHQLFGTAFMRDLGAVLGLTIGYVIKYRLDKRFVFGGGLGGAA